MVDTVRKSLENADEMWFRYLLISSAVVAFGCVLEIGETWIALRRWWQIKKDLPVEEENPKSWYIPVGALGLFLVIAGVSGECIFEAKVSRADTKLRAYDEERLEGADFRLGQTLIEVSARLIPDPLSLVGQLRRFAGKKIVARSYPSDAEAFFLCKALVEISNTADVHFADECSRSPPTKEVITGIGIFGPNEPTTFALGKALVNAGIPGGISVSPDGDIAHTPLTVFVGSKSPAIMVQYPKPNTTN